MSSYLGRHFDASLDVSGIGSREELEIQQVDRLKRSLAVVLIAVSIPRRLGGDASAEELAMDKRRGRRVSHALNQALGAWTKKKKDLPLDDTIRREGAQINWSIWGEGLVAQVNEQLRYVATWALTNQQEKWGKSAIVRLENELNWLTYALRD